MSKDQPWRIEWALVCETGVGTRDVWNVTNDTMNFQANYEADAVWLAERLNSTEP